MTLPANDSVGGSAQRCPRCQGPLVEATNNVESFQACWICGARADLWSSSVAPAAVPEQTPPTLASLWGKYPDLPRNEELSEKVAAWLLEMQERNIALQRELAALTAERDAALDERDEHLEAWNTQRLRAESAEANALTARGLVVRLVDPDRCYYDHHGYCQAHGYLSDGGCPHAAAREWLGTPALIPEKGEVEE